MKQLSLGFMQNYKKEFGGSLLIGKRKSKRPLSTKHPIHLVLKSSFKGVFNPSNKSLYELIKKQARKYGVRIYDLAINWSHIHCVIRIKGREDYLKFIRSLTSVISQRAKRHDSTLTQLFTLRPYTRIISWGRDFKRVLNYQVLNQLESFGLIKRNKVCKKPRKKISKKTNAKLSPKMSR